MLLHKKIVAHDFRYDPRTKIMGLRNRKLNLQVYDELRAVAEEVKVQDGL